MLYNQNNNTTQDNRVKPSKKIKLKTLISALQDNLSNIPYHLLEWKSTAMYNTISIMPNTQLSHMISNQKKELKILQMETNKNKNYQYGIWKQNVSMEASMFKIFQNQQQPSSFGGFLFFQGLPILSSPHTSFQEPVIIT